MTLKINAYIAIPLGEIEFTYARSSGPGGQNVNKVNSKAVLRWNALETSAFPPFARDQILARLTHALSQEGCIVLTSDRMRDQIRNREDCLQKLKELVLAATITPKARKETKPTFGSKRRVQASKQKNAEKKSLRKRPFSD